MGCNVVQGEGIALVITTGANNQLSKIASSVSNVKTKLTSLQIELNKFVMLVASMAIITAIVVVLVWALFIRVKYPKFMPVSTMVCLISIIELKFTIFY